MIFPKFGIYTLLSLLVWSQYSIAQNNTSDEPAALYSEIFANQQLVYNGHAYMKFPEPYSGSPIFGDDLWNNGTVLYDGQVYTNIDLFYDSYKDVLVVEHFDRNGHPTFFNPQAEKISFFTLNESKFITLSRETRELNKLPAGYYQELYVGKLNFYAKRITTLKEVEKQGKYIPTFTPEDKFYVEYQGAFYEVRNKRSLKKLFKDNKKQINQFSRENVLLFFTDDRENSLMKLIRHIDGIIETGGIE